MSEVIGFRRIRGRIIPIRRTSSSTSDKVKGFGALSVFAGSAYAAGRFVPPGGMVAATPRLRKASIFRLAKGMPNYKAALISGKTHLLVAGVLGSALPKAMGIEFNDHWDEVAGGAMTVGFALAAKKLAFLGKMHRSSAALKAATKGSKVSKLTNLLKGD